MEHLSIDLEDCPNQLENSHKLYNEMGHPIVILAESQWKLRQQHDWESYCRTILASEEINLKEHDCESQGSN